MAKTSNEVLEVTIHDAESGEIIVRPMTEDELAQVAKDTAAHNAAKAAKEKAEADKAALLARLGLTEDEAKLLLS
jgi:hypothetical protein